jgi:hypothetical protein
MTWQPVVKPKHHKAHDNMQLRLLNKYTGYLDVGSREFLFNGSKTGCVRFEENEDGMMTIVPQPMGVFEFLNGVRVSRQGRLSVVAVTARTSATLPISILLVPFEDEQRLIFAGVR